MWKNAGVPRSNVHPHTDCSFVEKTAEKQSIKHSVFKKGRCTPLLIKPSANEPYYTRSVWPIEECRCTQCRSTPHMKPSTTEPYYTRTVWHIEECRCTQCKSTPLLIKPSGTEPYYTRSVGHSCIRSAWHVMMQIYILQNAIEKAVDMRYDLLNSE